MDQITATEATIRKKFALFKIAKHPTDSTKEIHLVHNGTVSSQRHPHAFCQQCGRFGRKDLLKVNHFKEKCHVPFNRCGYVCHGQEPNQDKYGDFQHFKQYFGLDQEETDIQQRDTNSKQDAGVDDHIDKTTNQFIENSSLKQGNHKDNQNLNKQQRKDKDKMKTMSSPLAQLEPKCTTQILDDETQKTRNTKSSLKQTPNGTFQTQLKSRNQPSSRDKFGSIKLKLKQKLKQKMKKAKKILKKPVKSRVNEGTPTGKGIKGPPKKGKVLKTINVNSKRCKKVNAKTKNKEIKQLKKLKAPQIKSNADSTQSTTESSDKWKILLLKQRMKQAISRVTEVNSFYKEKLTTMIKCNRQEFLDINEQHKQFMLKEREKHCHLYNESAKFESTNHQLEEQMKCTALQRAEIIHLLSRLGEARSAELKNYPKNLMIDGQYDPVIWRLTREEDTGEQLSNQLKDKLKASENQIEKYSQENRDLKEQLNYASNHIQMLNSTNAAVIKNVLDYQNQIFSSNFSFMQEKAAQFQHQPLAQDENVMNLQNKLRNQAVDSKREQAPDHNELSHDSKQSKSVQFEAEDEIIDFKLIDVNNPRKSKRVWKKDKPLNMIAGKRQIKKISTQYKDKSVSNLEVKINISRQRGAQARNDDHLEESCSENESSLVMDIDS